MPEALVLKPTARAPSSPAPRPPASSASGRARPPSPRPDAMVYLGIPLSGLPDSVLTALDQLGPGWTWGRDAGGYWFVEDARGRRSTGRSLLGAIRVARAARVVLDALEVDP